MATITSNNFSNPFQNITGVAYGVYGTASNTDSQKLIPKSIASSIKVLLVLLFFPIIWIGLACFFSYLKRIIEKRCKQLQDLQLKTDKEYNALKKEYELLYISGGSRKLQNTKLGLFPRLLLFPLISFIKSTDNFTLILAKKLCLLPEAVTYEQLLVQEKNNQPIKEWFEEDENEFDYAKAMALGEL